jgi:UDP-glucose:glycoprotein glucosyltransferase
MTYSLDHHYSGARRADVTAVLYGDIATVSWREFNLALKRMARDNLVDYVHRHFTKVSTRACGCTRMLVQAVTGGDRSSGRIAADTPVRLSGYGIELAIKSQEYKAQDDAKIRANVSESGAVVEEQEEEEDLQGFNFKKLK